MKTKWSVAVGDMSHTVSPNWRVKCQAELFVVGAVEGLKPVWLGSCLNIGHPEPKRVALVRGWTCPFSDADKVSRTDGWPKTIAIERIRDALQRNLIEVSLLFL